MKNIRKLENKHRVMQDANDIEKLSIHNDSYKYDKKLIKINNNLFKSIKHFPSSVREWNNSVYFYNKQAINLIPTVTNKAIALIKSYFNLFNLNLERKMRTRRLLIRFRRLSSNKIYISNGEFKHTNNKVIITLYIFNRQKYNYLLSIKKKYLSTFLKVNTHRKISFKEKLAKILKALETTSLVALKEVNRDKYIVLWALNKIKDKTSANKYIKMQQYITNFYKKVLKKTTRKLKTYFYYKQLIYINRSKFNYTYIQYLQKYMQTLYNKNIEFNLVNLKRFYTNSDVLSESITLKLTKNRRRMLGQVNKLKNKVKIQKKKNFLSVLPVDNMDLNLKNDLNVNNILLRKHIISELKYRHVTGFRLQIQGRLSRRYTASRSVHKLRYKGNLLDIDSSFRGLSSVLLKGNLKSNVQYTKLESKTRIGAFGIKGWVSGN